MKTLLEILNEVSKECGCEDFRYATENGSKLLVEYIVDKAGIQFLKQNNL